jgi:catechol 2,3-dioxygenase-like lactoylglutathione lyase family enzyme
MQRKIATVAIVVRDYDEATAYYTGVLGFKLIEDTPLSFAKRWVVVGPEGGGTQLLLAKAASPEQASCIGNQTGGRVAFFLHTDDFRRDYEQMKARGVKFVRQVSKEPYGTVVVFEDLYGNKWDLIEPKNA